ncbi:hypothetical protein HYT57_04055 [Candidatus Woesearchaeota archaeon]|nr:hypothetical protein [Candidatus Woesearchaeota archaeon]
MKVIKQIIADKVSDKSSIHKCITTKEVTKKGWVAVGKPISLNLSIKPSPSGRDWLAVCHLGTVGKAEYDGSVQFYKQKKIKMTQTEYGIIKATEVTKAPIQARDLLRVPHNGGELIVGYPAFGPNTYGSNLSEMQKIFSHSKEFNRISFEEPTTAESISVYKFFGYNERDLYLGRVVHTSEGVFVNPPKNARRNPITDKKTLKYLLNRTKKVNGIYLGENDFGFAPYETFEYGEQDCDTFVKGGLARVLEHTEKKVAEKLREISPPNIHKAYVINKDYQDYKPEHGKSDLTAVMLNKCLDDIIVDIGIDYRVDLEENYTFGVLNLGEANKRNKLKIEQIVKAKWKGTPEKIDVILDEFCNVHLDESGKRHLGVYFSENNSICCQTRGIFLLQNTNESLPDSYGNAKIIFNDNEVYKDSRNGIKANSLKKIVIYNPGEWEKKLDLAYDDALAEKLEVNERS